MMTESPSGMSAKWRHFGVMPVLLMAMLVFSFTEKGNRLPATDMTDIESAFNAIDDNTEPPLFPGCEKVNEMEKADCSHKKLYEYVANNLKYPEELKTRKIEGKVFVKFVITNNGLVAQASIQKSLHPAADKAALDLVNGMNDKVGKWTPGTKEGRPVTTDMVLPISFVLNAKPESNSNDNSNSGAEVGSTSNANGEVYSFVDEMPRFPGCEDTDSSIINICAVDKMYNYIEGNIFYPKEDRENGKEGIVMAKFIVQTDGSISNARIVRGLTPSMDAEVLRMVNNMNNMPQHWTPGKKDGKSVAVEFTLPVFFALQPGFGEIKQSSSDSLHRH